MIHFKDVFQVPSGSDPSTFVERTDVTHYREQGDKVILVYEGGETSAHSTGDVTRQEGLLTLFSRTNIPLFFALLMASVLPLLLNVLRWHLLLRSHGW